MFDSRGLFKVGLAKSRPLAWLNAARLAERRSINWLKAVLARVFRI